MNNGFNKEVFIRENGLSRYTKLLDFLECEVTRNTYREIVALLSSHRIRKFVYDGERYLMLRESVNMPVRIFEKSALEKGLKEHQAKFDIPADALLSLIARYQIRLTAKRKSTSPIYAINMIIRAIPIDKRQLKRNYFN